MVDHICNSFSLAVFALEDELAATSLYFDKKKWQVVLPFIPIAQSLTRGPLENTHLKIIVTAYFNPV